MSKPAYPRKSVLEHRERLVDEATRGLAKAVTEREERERTKAVVEAERARMLAAAEELRRKEREALARGELKASDLLSGDAWEAHAKAEAHAADARVEEQKTKVEEAQSEEERARLAVANKKADVDVLVKDRARFDAEQVKRTDAREEEAAAEAYRPGHGAGGVKA